MANGLLDFIKTPEGQGLLSAAFGGLAGARRGQPLNSLGRAGLAGMQGYSTAIDRQGDEAEKAFQKQYRTLQMSKLEQDVASDKARQTFLSSLTQAPTAALAEGASVGEIGPTKKNAARMPAGLSRIPQDALLAEISLNGGKNLPEWMFKTGTPDMQVSNGYAYDKNGLAPGFLPGLSVSTDGKATLTQIDPVTGQPTISAPKGAVQTFSGYATAQEAAKAGFDPMPMTLPDGTSYVTTRGAVVNNVNTPQPTAPSAPAGNSPSQPMPPGGYKGSGYVGGSAAAAAQVQMPILEAELAKAIKDKNPRDIAALQREIGRLRGSSGGGGGAVPSQQFQPSPAGALPVPGIQVQSEADKQGAIARAKANAEATSGDKVAAKDAQRSSIQAQISVIDKALNHPGRETATGLSGVLDPRNYLPGTNARDFQVVLDQLNGSAFMQAFESLKGGGQITEIEGNKATAAIARLNRAQSDAEFQIALKDLRDVMSKGLSRLGGGVSGSWDSPAPAAPANSFDAKPPAQQYRGKTMRGPDGKRYQSDGMIWKEVR